MNNKAIIVNVGISFKRSSREASIGEYQFLLNKVFMAGVNMKAVFWQAIKNLYAHPRDLCFGPFCKFFGDF